MKATPDFHFKQFSVKQSKSAHKVGTDGVLLGAWADVDRVSNILDIGTGTGLIALMLAQRTSSATQIDAVEIQSMDADQALENFRNSPWKDRLRIHNVAIQNFEPATKYDLIVSNPPYFINSWSAPDKDRHAARHTTLLPFDDLLKAAASMLSASGRLAVILPVVEGELFISRARLYYLEVIRKTTVYPRASKPAERLLLELSGVGGTRSSDTLEIHANGNEWSQAYRDLTRDFYLKL